MATIRAGTRKAVVYATYQHLGPTMAMRVGKVLGLKESSIRGWISTWKTDGVVPVKNLRRIKRRRSKAA